MSLSLVPRWFSSKRSVSALVLALTATGTVACGGGGDGGGIVNPPPPAGGTVASVTLNQTTASIQVGGTVTLTATPRDAQGNALSGQTVTWTTTDGAIAAVNGGVVTGKGAGTATITAATGGKQAQATITVTPVPVASVSINPGSASLLVGVVDTTLGQVALTATAKDAQGNTLTGRQVTWTSSDTTIVTVSASGVVKAVYSTVAARTATITATSEGQTSSITVTVTRPPVARVAITPATSTIRVGGSVLLTVRLYDSQGNELSKRVIGPHNDSPSVIAYSITPTGDVQVTGQAAGTGTMTFASEGASGTATITVTP